MEKSKSVQNTSELHDSWALGNSALYRLCREYPLGSQKDVYSCEDILAGEMWLIGRSYAASPERYRYSLGYEKPAIQEDGYATFFDVISQKMINGEDKNKWTVFIDRLNQAKKCVGYSLLSGDEEICQEDKEILKESVILVFSFLELLRSARSQRDYEKASSPTCKPSENNNSFEEFRKADFFGQSYPLSFSSKFLHFHLPQMVFIFDAITNSHLRGEYLTKLKLSENESKIISNEGKMIASELLQDKNDFARIFEGYMEGPDLPGRLKEKVRLYTRHCCFAYAIARKHLSAGEKMLTRQTDILISQINSNCISHIYS